MIAPIDCDPAARRLHGRLLVLLSGFGCAVLFVTGVIRWRQKRRAATIKMSKRS